MRKQQWKQYSFLYVSSWFYLSTLWFYELFKLQFVLVVVYLNRVWLSAIPWTAACQAFLSFTISLSLLNSYQLSHWCHPTISSSVASFSFCSQPFSASGSFPISEFFASSGQSTGVSASALVLPMNIQDWSPLGWTGWISLQSNVLSSIFSNTTVQKHQFFSIQFFFVLFFVFFFYGQTLK